MFRQVFYLSYFFCLFILLNNNLGTANTNISNLTTELSNVGALTHYSANKNVAANTNTLIQTVDIPAGTVLLLFIMYLSASSTGQMTHNIGGGGRTVRTSESGGGGNVNFMWYRSDSATTESIYATSTINNVIVRN